MKAKLITSILHVSNLSDAIEFYVDKLRFEKDFMYGEPPYYAGIRKDGVAFHLSSSKCSSDRVGKSSVFINCDEVDEYWSDLKNKNVKVTSEPETYPYGIRDFQIEDPDGNQLCFGMEVSNHES